MATCTKKWKSTMTNVIARKTVEEEVTEITSDSSEEGDYGNLNSSDSSESNWPVVAPSSRRRPTPDREFANRRK